MYTTAGTAGDKPARTSQQPDSPSSRDLTQASNLQQDELWGQPPAAAATAERWSLAVEDAATAPVAAIVEVESAEPTAEVVAASVVFAEAATIAAADVVIVAAVVVEEL